MNISIDLPENAASFLVSLIPICLILMAFLAGVELAEKHFSKELTSDLDD